MQNKAEAMARAEKIFNSAADYFDAPALSFWNRFGQQTINYLDLQPGDRVLDVCCGSGASAIPAAIKVGDSGRVIGADLAESLLELGRAKARQQGLRNIEFLRGDCENLGFPDDSFDAIVCVFGIFFVPDMEGAIRELCRMLKPGGKLAITSWGKQVFEPANRVFWDAIAAVRPDLVKKFTPWDRIDNPQSLQALLEMGGAKQVQVFLDDVAAQHPLSAPEDWWTMCMGGGLRGTIDQLDPETRENIRNINIDFLRANQVENLEASVLYAVARN
jgi:ubiquinone/menaquinone biosynthesis C-methylase UbiE